MNRQRGVALVLVLMVTGILGLLMLQVGLTAREQVARAQRLSDRADAELLAQSREAAMAYSLLTQPWVEARESSADSANAYAAAWNFHGEPFELDGITYRVQDVSGLLPIPLPQDSPRAFLALLRQLDVEPQRAERLVAQLRALQGVRPPLDAPGRAQPDPGARPRPREAAEHAGVGFPVQSMAELRYLPDMDPSLLARVESLTTLYPTPGLNPLTAPPEVLAVRFDGSVLEGVLELRRQRRLDGAALYALAGVGADDVTSLSPGPALRIDLELRHAGITVRRETTWALRPYATEPLATWSRRRVPEAGA